MIYEIGTSWSTNCQNYLQQWNFLAQYFLSAFEIKLKYTFARAFSHLSQLFSQSWLADLTPALFFFFSHITKFVPFLTF